MVVRSNSIAWRKSPAGAHILSDFFYFFTVSVYIFHVGKMVLLWYFNHFLVITVITVLSAS